MRVSRIKNIRATSSHSTSQCAAQSLYCCTQHCSTEKHRSASPLSLISADCLLGYGGLLLKTEPGVRGNLNQAGAWTHWIIIIKRSRTHLVIHVDNKQQQAQWLSDRRHGCVVVVTLKLHAQATEASKRSLHHHNLTVTK